MKFSLELKTPKKSSSIIFSLPLSNHYQQIKNLKIQSNNYQILQEKRWGNEIIIFNDVKNIPQITFDFYPKSYQTNIPEFFFLKDYQNKKLKIINNRFINGNDLKIKKLAAKVIGKEKNIKKIAEKIYDFTLSYLTYDKPIEGLYSYKQALNEKITDCGGFSTFLASLLQSLNIPTRLVVGFLIKESFLKKILNTFHVLRFTLYYFKFYVPRFMFHDLLMHAWLEFQLPDNIWFPLDPSIEWRRNKGLTKRKGGFGFIPSDRLVISFGCDFKIKIDKITKELEILQNPVYL